MKWRTRKKHNRSLPKIPLTGAPYDRGAPFFCLRAYPVSWLDRAAARQY